MSAPRRSGLAAASRAQPRPRAALPFVRWAGVACALGSGMLACGSDPHEGSDRDIVEVFVPDTFEVSDTRDAPDTRDVLDSADSLDTSDALDTLDSADTLDVLDTADTRDTLDGLDTLDVVDALDTVDTGPSDPAACPVPSMRSLYPGPIPPFPYGTWPKAEGCIARPHDVIIVLGCPSETNGDPSRCQEKRAEIADQLDEAGWADHLIVTGAAVHNTWVEADALYALLVGRGVKADKIIKEPLARHTDENIYYATRIMQEHGWTSALIVSDDPGHLMMTAICDANCCVDLGHLTVYEWEIVPGLDVKAGHYALIPPATANDPTECPLIAAQIMCLNQADRLACKADFRL